MRYKVEVNNKLGVNGDFSVSGILWSRDYSMPTERFHPQKQIIRVGKSVDYK